MKIIKYILIVILVIIGINRYKYYKRWKEHVGIYTIDIKKTNLGEYAIDSNIYKQLTLEFKKDYTYNFNFEVPFIECSKGNWKIGGTSLYEWNYMYCLLEDTDFCQVYQCCYENRITMNSVTPKNGEKSVLKIIFKKK